MRKYNDGLLDTVIEKLKDVYAKIKAKFGRLSIAGKALTIIGKIIKCLSVAYLAKSSVEYFKAAMKLKHLRELLNKTVILCNAAGSGNTPQDMYNAHVAANGVAATIKIAVGIAGVGLGILLDRSGSLMKKSGGTMRGDSMYYDAVRRCDGAIDSIANKIKGLFQEAKETFKALPVGKKILFAISKIIKLVSAASVATDTGTLIALKVQMIKYQSMVDGLFSAAENVLPFRPLSAVLKGAGAIPHYLANRAIKNFTAGVSKPVLIRVLKASIAAAIGFVGEKIATIGMESAQH